VGAIPVVSNLIIRTQMIVTHDSDLKDLEGKGPRQTSQRMHRLLPHIEHRLALHPIHLGQDLLHQHLGLEAVGRRDGSDETHRDELAKRRFLVPAQVGREVGVHHRVGGGKGRRSEVRDAFHAELSRIRSIQCVVEERHEGLGIPRLGHGERGRRLGTGREPSFIDVEHLLLGTEEERRRLLALLALHRGRRPPRAG
jgi:hypothetical protein